MDISPANSPRLRLDHLRNTHLRGFELERSDNVDELNHRLRSLSALEILRETVRILRYNCTAFMGIAASLICPVSAVLLTNFLVDQSLVKRLTLGLLLVSKSCGLPLRPFIKHLFQKFAEMAMSSAMCFPLYITLSLLSKAAIVYSVECSYSRKKFDPSLFYSTICKIWRRLVSTYMWTCMVVLGCLILFFLALAAVCNAFSLFGFSSDIVIYGAVSVGLVFSVLYANAIIICSIAIVISVLEDVSGPKALLRSCVLIKGQIQVGLLIFIASTFGTAFVEGLYEHRVKTLSYGDGSSRIWEGPLLVIMYSFIVLIYTMVSAVFYYSCRCSSMEAAEVESQPILENETISADSMCIQ